MMLSVNIDNLAAINFPNKRMFPSFDSLSEDGSSKNRKKDRISVAFYFVNPILFRCHGNREISPTRPLIYNANRNEWSPVPSVITPLCNRPTGTRPSGLFSPTQWKFRLPSTQRMFLFYPAIFVLPQ